MEGLDDTVLLLARGDRIPAIERLGRVPKKSATCRYSHQLQSFRERA